MNEIIGQSVPLPIKILVIVLTSLTVLFILNLLTKYLLKQADKKNTFLAKASESLGTKGLINTARGSQRTKTITTFVKNILNVIIIAATIVTVLAALGISVQPLLASLGIISLTVGFGVQTIIRDFVSGVMITFEDQYGIGDIIEIGSLVGVVEEIGLRITKVRDTKGIIWYIRNGEIVQLGNHSKKI